MLEVLYALFTNTRTKGLCLSLADSITDTARPSMASLFPEMDAMPRGKPRRAAKKEKGTPRSDVVDPPVELRTFDVEMTPASTASLSGAAQPGPGPDRTAEDGSWTEAGGWDTKRAKTSVSSKWQPRWQPKKL